MLPPIPYTQVLTDIVTTVHLMYQHLSDNIEQVKTAPLVPISQPTLLIQPPAAQPTAAVTQVPAATAITAARMLLYPQVSGEMGKTALLAAMLLPTQPIRVTVAQPTAVLIQVTAATALTVVRMQPYL